MYLTEYQVSASRLADIFKNELMEVSQLRTDFFRVKGDSIKIGISIDFGSKLLILGFAQMLSNINFDNAAQIANKLNNESVLVKFSAALNEGDVFLNTEYFMNFEEGLIGYQLYSNVRFFEEIVINAVKQYFLAYLPR